MSNKKFQAAHAYLKEETQSDPKIYFFTDDYEMSERSLIVMPSGNVYGSGYFPLCTTLDKLKDKLDDLMFKIFMADAKEVLASDVDKYLALYQEAENSECLPIIMKKEYTKAAKSLKEEIKQYNLNPAKSPKP